MGRLMWVSAAVLVEYGKQEGSVMKATVLDRIVQFRDLICPPHIEACQ